MRKLQILCLLILFLFVMVACSEFTPELTRIRLAIGSEPSTLDPHRSSEPASSEVFGWTCETLIYQGLDGSDQPLLADHFEMASDGLSMTLTLRKGVHFHDGTSLTSEAVVYTFARLQDEASVNSPIYPDFQNVKFETPDEYTVIFKFDEPRPAFSTTLRNGYAVIISPSSANYDEGELGRNPICTGPYQVKEWKSGEYVLLERYADYQWAAAYYQNRGPAKIDEVQIYFISDDNTRYLALQNREIDMLSLSTPEEVNAIRQNPTDFDLYESWVGGISYVGFNYQRSPTNELLIRQALSHAISKDEIVASILPGMGDPAFAPLAPSVFGFSSTLKQYEYVYDPNLSKQLLAGAGFLDTDGDGVVERNGKPFHLTILTLADDAYNNIFVIIQSQLAEVGVSVDILTVSSTEIPEITPTGEFDILLFHYNWPFPSALSLFLSSERIGSSNRVWYSNPDVDKLLAQADLLPNNSEEKKSLLVEAQQLILHDAPWQPLLVRKIITAVNHRVQGIQVHPAGGLLLHDAYIENNK